MILKNNIKKINFYWFAGIVLLALPVNSQSIRNSTTTARKFVQELAVKASSEQIATQDEIRNLEMKIKQTKSDLKNAIDKSEKSFINTELVDAKKKLTLAKRDLKNKITASKKYRNLLSLDDSKLIVELKKQKLMPTDQSSAISSANQSDKIEKADKKVAGMMNKSTKQMSTNETPEIISIPSSSMLDPINECKYQVVTDKKKSALEPEILFTYTPEELKKHLKGIPYSKGWAFIAREPGYILLQLKMEIASEQALDYYGNLSKSFMTIKLVNGKEVRLINSGFDSGKIDRYKKASIISGIFNIDKPTEKVLMSSEIDTIKLNLISGFEIYTIYNVDFFTRQLNCINSLK